jgi:DNA repair exonuclease SbcCD ATPase subunit
MKSLLSFIVLALLFIGCDKSQVQELERKNTQLQQQYESAVRDLSVQSSYINDVTNAINGVYSNMQKISEGETMLSKSTKELETGKAAMQTQLREQILSQISGIDNYLAENRKKLKELENKLKSANRKYAGLQQMVETLKQTLAEKEQAIASLETKLKDMNIQILSLEERLAQKTESEQQKEQVISSQKKEINSAFYLVGTFDELEKMNIIENKGGILGIGSTTTLASGFDKSEFITIDKNEQTTIEIDGKVDELIPKRKQEYYTLTQDGASAKLLILDTEKFWTEQYLVIVTK